MLLTKVKIKELYTSIDSWFWFVFFADVIFDTVYY